MDAVLDVEDVVQRAKANNLREALLPGSLHDNSVRWVGKLDTIKMSFHVSSYLLQMLMVYLKDQFLRDEN